MCRRICAMPIPPQKILVIHVAGLARTTLALPALGALRYYLPATHITVAASAGAAGVIRLSGCADEVLSVGRLSGAEVLGPRAAYRTLQALSALRRESFDLAIELERGAEAGLLLFAARPKRWMKDQAAPSGKLKQLIGRIAEVLPGAPTAPRHAAQRYLDAIAPLGAYPLTAQPRLPTDRAADERIEKRLSKASLAGEMLVGIHAGAGRGHPRWPLEQFADVAARLVHVYNTRVLVFAGRGEKAQARQLVKMLPPKSALALEELPLADAASALARLSVLVANHSGVAHLAAAVGTPVVAVSATASPSPLDLLGKHHRHVRGPHIEAISPDEVYEAACCLLSLNRAELLTARG